jgi:hypothetical protein
MRLDLSTNEYFRNVHATHYSRGVALMADGAEEVRKETEEKEKEGEEGEGGRKEERTRKSRKRTNLHSLSL